MPKNDYPYLHRGWNGIGGNFFDLVFNPPLLERERECLIKGICIDCGKPSRLIWDGKREGKPSQMIYDASQKKSRRINAHRKKTLLFCESCAKKHIRQLKLQV